ncbi:DUF6364 family protein [Dyadobacter sp. CY323]|uniref:DUF6364 family protein n=1 Tax=Dyadobacter sp. CY323 TaxID=2907302 RepID=UPI001F27C64D|nr:DUF6364 family protein [Dyadobacter sp. CY323]
MKAEKDPKVKLTVSVKKSVIEKAKKYASENGTSVSQLIEDHLVGLKDSETNEPSKKLNIADQLYGCASGGPLSNMTDKEIKDLMIKDKFGL